MHPILQIAKQLGIETIGSKTISDMALIPCNAVKIGPGDSLRSHTADEFIGINELEEGIAIYKEILLNFKTYYETLG
jgi:acetylornithine deacetylase